MSDIVLDHEFTCAMENEDILEMLNRLFPKRHLYSMSLDWRKSIEYILKARGTGGDVIVDWSASKYQQFEQPFKLERVEDAPAKLLENLKEDLEYWKNYSPVIRNGMDAFLTNSMPWEVALITMVKLLAQSNRELTNYLTGAYEHSKDVRELQARREMWILLKATNDSIKSSKVDGSIEHTMYKNLICFMDKIEKCFLQQG